MEDNRKFELDDELLDDVAGGTGGSGATGFSVGDRVKLTTSNECPSCRRNWNDKVAQVHRQLDPSYNINPIGTVTDISAHRGGMSATVVFECCNGEVWFDLSYLEANFTLA